MKELVANCMTSISEPQRNCTSVLPLAAHNKTVSNEPVNKPNCARMR